jgi:hypothetical protein
VKRVLVLCFNILSILHGNQFLEADGLESHLTRVLEPWTE